MKKITILLLCFVCLFGCSIIEKEQVAKDTYVKSSIEVDNNQEYVDDNPIKLGLFLYDDNYQNKEVIKDTYYADFISNKEIGSFEVFLTDSKVINGKNFKDTWNKYYDMYDNIDNYKIGFNIKFMLYDGTSYEGNILEPDIYKFGRYFYIYLYDDIHQTDGTFYSHLESMNENTLITSIKLYAVDCINEVESIILSTFTYDNEDDFDNDNYRGNSLYVIRIKRN